MRLKSERQIIAKNVASLRLAKNLNVAALARLADVNPQTISNMEKVGDLRPYGLNALTRVALALGVTSRDLKIEKS